MNATKASSARTLARKTLASGAIALFLATAAQADIVIDDFEDGDGISNQEERWFGYDGTKTPSEFEIKIGTEEGNKFAEFSYDFKSITDVAKMVARIRIII